MTGTEDRSATIDSIKRAIRQRERGSGLRGVDYRQFSRQLRELSEAGAIKLTILGNITSDLLVPFLTVSAAREGFQLKCRVGNFGQQFQDLQEESIAAFGADMVLLLLSLELLRPNATSDFAALDPRARQSLVEEISTEISQWVGLAERVTQATIIISNFPQPVYAAMGLADATAEYSEADFFSDLNRSLALLAQQHPRVQVLDLAAVTNRIGRDDGEDRRLFFVAKVGWTERLMAEIGRQFVRHIIAATGRSKKCLVLDLDNTLWGGVVGEDGPSGVRIGPGDPEGEAFQAFQARVKGLKQRGVLLALCSKNTPSEIDALFAERTDMPLVSRDFAARAIGWDTKDQGLVAIAEQLNIGLDSLVFVDDNPAEVALVQSRLPMVETVQLPNEPALYVATLDRLPYFERSHLTDEDMNKAEQYAAVAEREIARADAKDEFAYLRSLGMKLELRAARAADLTRVHQLIAKTSQFNTTTRRYSYGELEDFLASSTFRIDIASLKDRFGDFGMIACMLVDCSDERAWRIASFVMSCRAMGRGVETAMLDRWKKKLFDAQRRAPTRLVGEFIATARNAPASNLYLEQGFTYLDEDAQGVSLFQIDNSTASSPACDWIEIKQEAL